MKNRLASAIDQSILEEQYEVTCTLCIVIDAMADVSMSGISHENLYQPLIGLLDGLSQNPELHLAQAASYAAQALRGIEDNDTIGQASLRGLVRAIDLAMMVAGAATSVDPGKIWESAKSGFESGTKLKDYTWNEVKKHTGKCWYTALRTTSHLIRYRAWDELEKFIQEAENRGNTNFLCGLYSQLEQACSFIPTDQAQRIYAQIPESKEERVKAWVSLSAPGRNEQESALAATSLVSSKGLTHGKDTSGTPKGKRNFLRGKMKKETFDWTLKAFNWELSSEPSESDGGKGFLENAFVNCENAKEYYTRNALMRFYSHNDNRRLEIQRLLGQRLPMEHCYINLTVLETSKSETVSLPKVFDARQKNYTTIKPERIFVEGQAGVGKTTLCKKIVYDFLYQEMWSDRFDWILWLPLRNLKNKPGGPHSLEDLFRDEYFSQEFDRDLYAKTLESVVRKNGDRVLFLLDGLDEISQDWNDDTPMDKLLQALLQQPRVILSSRPYHMDQLRKDKFDLQLKTVGFSEEDIESYVHGPSIQPDYKKASEMWSFLQQHPRILDIAQIPVQLDALCYTWEDLSSKTHLTRTMTTIYEAISMKVLGKDACRMNKQTGGNSITDKMLEDLTDGAVQDIMQEEVNYLEGLAFHGLYNKIIEFDHSTRNDIHQHLKRNKIPVPQLSGNTLRSLSFLRTSDMGLVVDKQAFHFLHLTFQEFFAARHFVRYWVLGSTIRGLPLTETAVVDTSPLQFLAHTKYDVRYGMFWRFVAGLLYCHKKENNSKEAERLLLDYFMALEAKPRDLLGPSHQYLIMHCLSEVPPLCDSRLGFELYRNQAHEELSHWVAFEGDKYGISCLGSERGCPDWILYKLLLKKPLERKLGLFTRIIQRAEISREVTDSITSSLVNHFIPDKLFMPFLMLLIKNFQSLSPQDSAVLIDHLWNVPLLGMLDLYQFRGSCAQEILGVLAGRFEEGDCKTRLEILGILEKQPVSKLRDWIGPIAAGLADQKPKVKEATIRVLIRQPDLPLNMCDSIFQYLKGSSAAFHNSILDLFTERQLSKSGEILNYFLTQSANKREDLIERRSEKVQLAVCNTAELQSNTIDHLVEMLTSEQPYVREWTANLLMECQELPDKVLESITQTLTSINQVAEELSMSRGRAVWYSGIYEQTICITALKGKAHLPRNIINLLGKILFYGYFSLREDIFIVLLGMKNRPDDILDLMAKALSDDLIAGMDVRKALRESPDLPRKILDCILEIAKNSNNDHANLKAITLLEEMENQTCKKRFQTLFSKNSLTIKMPMPDEAH